MQVVVITARLVGLIASCGDEFRSQLLAADALQQLVDALEDTEILTAPVSKAPVTPHADQNAVCGCSFP